MKKRLVLFAVTGALLAILAGCGTTPEPTPAPPTQTPWIVVVTSTSGAPAEPTQAPATVATPAPSPTSPPRATPVSPTSGPQATEAGPTAAAPSPTPAAPTSTDAPSSSNTVIKYPPPSLLEPPDNRPVSWQNSVLLKWTPVGELAEDEYYHVHLERRPRTAQEPWYGDYVYTRDTEFWAEGAFLAPFHPPQEHGHGVVYWWVRVVRQTGEDQNGKPIGIDISPYSEERTLILDPKPGDS
jgi:hypothetical protein